MPHHGQEHLQEGPSFSRPTQSSALGGSLVPGASRLEKIHADRSSSQVKTFRHGGTFVATMSVTRPQEIYVERYGCAGTVISRGTSCMPFSSHRAYIPHGVPMRRPAESIRKLGGSGVSGGRSPIGVKTSETKFVNIGGHSRVNIERKEIFIPAPESLPPSMPGKPDEVNSAAADTYLLDTTDIIRDEDEFIACKNRPAHGRVRTFFRRRRRSSSSW